MHATLWKVTGERWEKVEELNVPSPPPGSLITPRIGKLTIRDYKAGDVPTESMMETDTYMLWRVWHHRDEAVYVQRVHEDKGV